MKRRKTFAMPCVFFPAIYRFVMKKDGYINVPLMALKGAKRRRASKKL
jgi:hypothetical protein